jgi:hypothetical protein
MAPTDKTWREQIERDLLTLAELVIGTHGLKPRLVEIIERYKASTPAMETRPSSPPESRAA